MKNKLTLLKLKMLDFAYSGDILIKWCQKTYYQLKHKSKAINRLELFIEKKNGKKTSVMSKPYRRLMD